MRMPGEAAGCLLADELGTQQYAPIEKHARISTPANATQAHRRASNTLVFCLNAFAVLEKGPPHLCTSLWIRS
ncbi:unnamed protein product [Toxocara canis]|uniref:Transposase n=1 Tax=Toxocara canis TaxID=6265 RepID=A0A183TXP1_TOXCA|nr:unnamed protein product [Toxocara canis]